jgi:bifunctional non-homologous end joining protein LigD
MPKSAFEPCIPTRGTTVPDRPEWIHEIKHDGYRLIIQRDGKRVRLFTRNGHDWSDRFPPITEAALRNRHTDRRRGRAARRRWPIGLHRPALAPAR